MCVIEISPVVETRRLVLRAPRVEDAPCLAALANDIDVARMTLRMPHPYGFADAEAFIASVQGQDPRRGATFVIDHEDLGAVGVIGLFEDGDPAPETGYWIGRPFWGRGFATEALEGALVWAGRQWRRRALLAGHFADNPA
jgi:RimJ/RimL family protein N-acetyltransferase